MATDFKKAWVVTQWNLRRYLRPVCWLFGHGQCVQWAWMRGELMRIACMRCGSIFKDRRCDARVFDLDDVVNGAVANPCHLPPPGWWCARADGHKGPCPTRPM